MRIFTSFLGATATATFLTRYVTDGRLPWWLNTLLTGGFLGALTALVMRLTLEEELQTVEEIMKNETD